MRHGLCVKVQAIRFILKVDVPHLCVLFTKFELYDRSVCPSVEHSVATRREMNTLCPERRCRDLFAAFVGRP